MKITTTLATIATAAFAVASNVSTASADTITVKNTGSYILLIWDTKHSWSPVRLAQGMSYVAPEEVSIKPDCLGYTPTVIRHKSDKHQYVTAGNSCFNATYYDWREESNFSRRSGPVNSYDEPIIHFNPVFSHEISNY